MPASGPVGFELASALEMMPIDGAVRCCERRDGRTVGELVVQVFAAALVIDRDGILESIASDATGAPAVPVVLPGATGFRSEVVERAPLPYRYVFAVASHDLGIAGGVIVSIRCESPVWPAAESILRSLRIDRSIDVHRTAPVANDEQPED